MEPVFALAAVALVLAAFGARRSAREVRHWSSTARRLGLRWYQSPRLETMSGEIDGVRVEVTQRRYGGRSDLSVVAEDDDSIDPNMRLSREWFVKGPASGELQIGEREFDRKVYLEGLDDKLAAVLSAGARESFIELMRRHQVEVELGRVQVSAGGNEMPAADVEETIAATVALFRHLAGGGRETAVRLLEHARTDPHPEVRKTNLRLLFVNHPTSPAANEAVELAHAFLDPELRVLAAAHAARRQRDGTALSLLIRSGSMPVDSKLMALHVSRLLGRDFLPALRAALPATDGEVQGAVAMRLAELGDDDDVALICTHAAGATGVAAAGFCAAFRMSARALDRPRAEALLLHFLEDDASDTQEAAAIALAELGTAAAVPALLERTTGLLRSTAVKSAARAAVAVIQAHIEGAEAGDLSLVAPDDTTGELSIAAESGELRVT